uniref:Uncharacterized protein n=1 Tax=Glossina palpalis gambiensis TaxID=67801 RepID=A0A1B0ASY4_9MUSC
MKTLSVNCQRTQRQEGFSASRVSSVSNIRPRFVPNNIGPVDDSVPYSLLKATDQDFTFAKYGRFAIIIVTATGVDVIRFLHNFLKTTRNCEDTFKLLSVNLEVLLFTRRHNNLVKILRLTFQAQWGESSEKIVYNNL